MKGRTVFITGASRGIGAAAARAFAAQGANVALAARSSDALAAVASEIGGNALALACDVADRAALDAAVDEAVAAFGRLDVMVNNAGLINPIGRIDEIDPEAWGRVIDVNVKGVFHGMRAALAHMPQGGTILTIGSGAATSPLEGWSHYCASKAAVHHLNRCLHVENQASGIRALVLSPGTVATEMQKDIRGSGINPVSRMDWSEHVPPDWPARALVWMCSAAADAYLGGVVSLREPAVRRAVGLIS